MACGKSMKNQGLSWVYSYQLNYLKSNTYLILCPKAILLLLTFKQRYFGHYYSLEIWYYKMELFYKTTMISCLTIEKNGLIYLTLLVFKFKVISLVMKCIVLKIF